MSICFVFSSLLSTLLSTLSSFLALAGSFHFAACEHTTIMGLQELGCLVKGVLFLTLISFFLIHDGFKSFALTTLFNSLGPLLADLTQLVFGVLAVGLRLILLFILLR